MKHGFWSMKKIYNEYQNQNSTQDWFFFLVITLTSFCLNKSDVSQEEREPALVLFHSKPLWWKLIKCPAITHVSISPTPVPDRSMLYQWTRSLGNTICCRVMGHTALWGEAKWINGISAESENDTNKKGSDFSRCNIGLEWGGQRERCNMRYCLFLLLFPLPVVSVSV